MTSVRKTLDRKSEKSVNKKLETYCIAVIYFFPIGRICQKKKLILDKAAHLSDTDAYICGILGLIYVAHTLLLSSGGPARRSDNRTVKRCRAGY